MRVGLLAAVVTSVFGLLAGSARAESICEPLWAVSTAPATRAALSETCEETQKRGGTNAADRVRLQRLLQEVSLAAGGTGLMWRWRTALALAATRRFCEVRPAPERWWEFTDPDVLANLRKGPSGGAPHPLQLVFKAGQFAKWVSDKNKPDLHPEDFDYLTIVVRNKGEIVYWLPDDAVTPVLVPSIADRKIDKVNPRVEQQLRYLAVPKGRGGMVAVYPQPSAPGDCAKEQGCPTICKDDLDRGPPLLYRTAEATGAAGNPVLDTTTDRREVHLYVKTAADDRVLVNGHELEASLKTAADGRVLVNGQELEASSPSPLSKGEPATWVFDRTLSIRASERAELAVGRRAPTDSQAPAHGSAPPGYRAIARWNFDDNVGLDLRPQGKELTALLPVSTSGCAKHGVDEARLKDRIGKLFMKWNVGWSDLGLFGTTFKAYVDAARGTSGSGGTDLPLSRGPLATDEQLASSLQRIYAQGFRYLLDIRLSCLSTAAGDEVFSVSGVRVKVPTTQEDDGDDPTSHLKSTTEVVSGVSLLNEGMSTVLARLLEKTALRIDRSDKDLVLGDDFRTRIVVTGATPDQMKGLDAKVLVLPSDSDSDLCGRVQAWNQLRGDAAFASAFKGGRHVDVNPSRDAAEKETQLDYTPKAPGAHVIRVSVPESNTARHAATPSPAADGAMRSGNPDVLLAEAGLSAYRCVRAVPPSAIMGATYFSPSWLGSWPHNGQRVEVSNPWFLLGYFGGVNGLGGSLGISHQVQNGIGPSSWDQTADITTSTVSGAVPYRVEVWSLSPGLNWALRWYPGRLLDFDSRLLNPWYLRWVRSLNVNLRLFALVRFDITNTSGVPASLGGFAQRKAGAFLDLTFGTTLDLTLDFKRFHDSLNGLSLHCALLFACPRASNLFINQDLDERRTVYYDPTILYYGLGLGMSYTWNR